MLRFKFRSIVVANLRRAMPLLAAAALVLSPAAVQADLGDQLFKLLPDDGAETDLFGISVAISGTTAIVGARWDDDNGDYSGSAYLFDITTGRQLFKLLPNDGAEGDIFGGSVAISGATAIVGASRDDDNGSDFGSAYLFDISDPANPTQIAKLLGVCRTFLACLFRADRLPCRHVHTICECRSEHAHVASAGSSRLDSGG